MTDPSPSSTPLEHFLASLVRLVMGIGGRVSWGGLSPKMVQLICDRIRANKLRIERIVAQIRAGTYVFRRRIGKPRAPAATPRPRPPPSPLPPKFGWLMPLIPVRPEESWHANAYRAQLEDLLSRPDMVALIEAAPASLGRPLRSLCWMFGLRPPPILARPARPRPARPKAPDRPKAPRPAPLPSRPPSRPDAPAWMQNWPPPVRGSRKLA
jgi:hypothetical protein